MADFPRDWVACTDLRGIKSVLPPRLRVCECASCGAICCRESIALSVPRLNDAIRLDWLRILAGRILGRPFCELCYPAKSPVIR